MNLIDQDLLSIQEARILAECGREAQKKLASFSQEQLDRIVEQIAAEAEVHSEELAHLSQEETEYGRWQDKLVKNRFVCQTLRQQLRSLRCVGIITEDHEKQTADVGVPLGLIVALPPATSPVSVTISTAMIALKAGNAIVISPHPRARKTIGKVLDWIIAAAESAGLPKGALAYLHTVTLAGTQELMRHQATALIMNTGVPAMLEACYRAEKPVIYGGNGHGPAFIERTANLQRAVADLMLSKTFDYGMGAGAEQSVVVDGCVADAVRKEFEQSGAYFLSAEETKQLGDRLFPKGQLDTELVGHSAEFLADKAGLQVPSGTKLLIAAQSYVPIDQGYRQELLCPVLAWYVEEDWQHACEKCIELLLTEGTGHTLVIHSQDEAVIRQFALQKPVGRVLVNTPATLGSIGITTNLFPALTLGSGSAGKGITADNVSPFHLIYIRKVGYGVRDGREAVQQLSGETGVAKKEDAITLEQMVRLLLKQEMGQHVEKPDIMHTDEIL